MVNYSNSKISTFEQCGQKYKFQYIDKVETDVENTIEAFMGDLVHRTLEKQYKDLQFTKLNSKEELVEYYLGLWKEEYNSAILIVKDYGPEQYREKGKVMIEEYYDKYKPFDEGKTIGLETTDFYDLDDNYKIHVRIDRLVDMGEGVYEIHDYKTNSSLKTQKEADEDRQLAIYSLGVKDKYPDAKKVVLVWHYLAFNKELRSERTDEQLDELKLEILDSIKKIESEKEFATRKSGLCDYCAYKKMCPAWKHLFDSIDVSEDFGRKLVDRYALLKEKEDFLNKKLNEVSEKIKLYAEKKKVNTLYGAKMSVTIWSKDAVKVPGKNDPGRAEFIKQIKNLNLFEVYSDLDTWAFEKDFEKLSAIEQKALSRFITKKRIEKLYLNKTSL